MHPDLAGIPGKRTLVEQLQVQRVVGPAGVGQATADVHAAAAHGTSGSGGALPHLDTIQRLFGRHDVSHVKAHTDDAAREGAAAMGAQAFASGDRIAFAGTPDLHTAAHEAAHVVQQRAGVQLKGGVGELGDPHEQHADAVADRVMQGESAEPLLDRYAGNARPASTAVQRVTLLDLAGAQIEIYDKITKWVKDGSKERRALDVEKLLHHAPTFDAFVKFMRFLRDRTDSPSLGFNERAFYDEQTTQYFQQYPTPIQLTKSGWGGAPTNTLTTNNSNSPPPTNPSLQMGESPTHPDATFVVYPSAMKHFKDLKKNSPLPRNQQMLQTFVIDAKASFGDSGDHWTLSLGDVPTHEGGGSFEIAPWSIMISHVGAHTWRVFHYGPTGMEQD